MEKQRSLLSRVVKQDKKGIYFSYGGYRFRPTKNTLANLGSMIMFESPFRRTDDIVNVIVMGQREIWKQTLVLSEYRTHHGKTFQFTRPFYACFCFSFSLK
jgi:hypothetical protein